MRLERFRRGGLLTQPYIPAGADPVDTVLTTARTPWAVNAASGWVNRLDTPPGAIPPGEKQKLMQRMAIVYAAGWVKAPPSLIEQAMARVGLTPPGPTVTEERRRRGRPPGAGVEITAPPVAPVEVAPAPPPPTATPEEIQRMTQLIEKTLTPGSRSISKQEVVNAAMAARIADPERVLAAMREQKKLIESRGVIRLVRTTTG